MRGWDWTQPKLFVKHILNWMPILSARAALILGQIHVLPEFITTKVVKMKAG
jgi:hypothetical protein